MRLGQRQPLIGSKGFTPHLLLEDNQNSQSERGLTETTQSWSRVRAGRGQMAQVDSLLERSWGSLFAAAAAELGIRSAGKKNVGVKSDIGVCVASD